MFDRTPISVPGQGSIRECRPDYEEMAVKLKKKIDANKLCLDGMKAGISFGSVNLSRDQSVLYYGIIGHLSVHIPNLEENYNALLKKAEEA